MGHGLLACAAGNAWAARAGARGPLLGSAVRWWVGTLQGWSALPPPNAACQSGLHGPLCASPAPCVQVCNEGDELVAGLCADHGCSLIKVPQVRRAGSGARAGVEGAASPVCTAQLGSGNALQRMDAPSCCPALAPVAPAHHVQPIAAPHPARLPMRPPACHTRTPPSPPAARWWTAWPRW